MSRCSTSPISARRSRRLSQLNTTLDDNDDRDSIKSEPLSPLPADPPAEENLLGSSIDRPITWLYHDIEDDEEPANSGRYGLSSRAKDPSFRYRQPRPLRKMEAFHCQELWQVGFGNAQATFCVWPFPLIPSCGLQRRPHRIDENRNASITIQALTEAILALLSTRLVAWRCGRRSGISWAIGQ